MGPIERSIPSVIELMRADGASPKAGRPLAIERVYQANFIGEDTFLMLRDEMDKERRARSNADSISAMEAEADDLAERMRRAHVPSRYVGCAVDLTHSDALSGGGWMYVHGDDSDASAYAACAALKGWLKAERFGVAVFEWSTSLLSEFRDNPETDTMSRYANVGMLVVAGLGSEPATDWALSKLSELLHRREGDGRPTIVTSTCGPDRLAEHLSSRGGDDVARDIMATLRRRAVLVGV